MLWGQRPARSSRAASTHPRAGGGLGGSRGPLSSWRCGPELSRPPHSPWGQGPGPCVGGGCRPGREQEGACESGRDGVVSGGLDPWSLRARSAQALSLCSGLCRLCRRDRAFGGQEPQGSPHGDTE